PEPLQPDLAMPADFSPTAALRLHQSPPETRPSLPTQDPPDPKSPYGPYPALVPEFESDAVSAPSDAGTSAGENPAPWLAPPPAIHALPATVPRHQDTSGAAGTRHPDTG